MLAGYRFAIRLACRPIGFADTPSALPYVLPAVPGGCAHTAREHLFIRNPHSGFVTSIHHFRFIGPASPPCGLISMTALAICLRQIRLPITPLLACGQ